MKTPNINIDPPKDDRTCDCCGRHVSELKPFGKAGDPLVRDFDGFLLLRDHMPKFPTLEESEIILGAFFNGCDDAEAREEANRRFIEEFGEEDANFINMTCGVFSNVGSVWLCRDCIVLDDDDYFNKLFEMYDYGLSMQGLRTRARSILEKCKQMDPVLCSIIEEKREQAAKEFDAEFETMIQRLDLEAQTK